MVKHTIEAPSEGWGLHVWWVRPWQGCVLQVLLWGFQGLLRCHPLFRCHTWRGSFLCCP